MSTSANSLSLSFKKGTKPELLTLMEIARGVVSGMLSDHFQGRHQDTFEASLRPHILATAQKRGWAVMIEFKLPKISKGKGSFKKIDYVLQYGRQVISIECKTVRPKVKSVIELQEDIKKLRRFTLLASSEHRVSCWQIVAWDSSSVKLLGGGNPNKINTMVKKAFLNQQLIIKTEADVINERTVKANQGVLIEGNVGAFRAYCLVVCVELPTVGKA